MSTLKKLYKIDKTGELRYGISLPSEYNASPEKSWPVLCFLHGRGECGHPGDTDKKIEDTLTGHGPLGKRISSQKATDDFIVVLPQLLCPHGKDKVEDVWLQYADDVKEIVKTIQKEYGGDQKCTYLTGFSYGGNGVFEIALAQSSFWAALWPVDPTRVPKEKPKCPVWLFSRSKNDLGFQKVKEDEPKTLNGDFLYTHSDKDHVGTATFAYSQNEAYDWLRKKYLKLVKG
jgi:predicted peptidase